LARADFAPDIIEKILAECEAAGWIDDEAFAQRWVEDRADRKKFGAARLAAELRRKGIDKETVTEALSATSEEEELERARAAARSKWRADVVDGLAAEELETEKRKLANFLQRRGFSWRIITQVLAETMANRE
jgi:regulatory protein